jgi:inosose dehydratase
MLTRRSFIKKAATVAAVTTAGSVARNTVEAKPVVPLARQTFRLGVAGYTFVKFKLDQTLEMLKKVDAHFLCIKDFHLPLTSSDEEIAAFHANCRASGVEGYGVGPIYMGTPDEVSKAFAYAKRVGVRTVVGVPFRMAGDRRVASPELLKLINEKVQEYDFKYAIHNHGPDMPELFPSAESAMEMIQHLDRRVGLCLDIGHEFRDGKDPCKALSKFSARVHDIHLKNVTAPNRDGRGVELPRGAIDLVAFVRVLRRIRYQGVCSLEYEKDMDAPLPGIAESIGYFRGLLDAQAGS